MVKVSTGKKFDYTALTTEQRLLAERCAAEVYDFKRRTTRDAIRIGRELQKVKAALGHGQFLKWVNAEFDWSADTAERLMKVADRFGDIPHGADIGMTALYLLAGDKVPVEARREALARAETGESITKAVAHTIKEKYLAPANGGTEGLLSVGEGPLDAGDLAVLEDSADVAPESPIESSSGAAPASTIAAAVAVAPADTVEGARRTSTRTPPHGSRSRP